jgi:GNAT superfamily N-acetyltransferase
VGFTDPREYRALGYMIDGSPFFIRAVREWDRRALVDLFNRCSSRSRYMRFFENKRSLTDAELDYYTKLDFYHHVALAAQVAKENNGLVAVARYIEMLPEQSPRRAEVAFLTRDDYHGKGVATQLLKHLIRIARDNNIGYFEAEMLVSNTKMLEVFEHSGYEIQHNRELGTVRVGFPIRDERIPF